MNIDGLGKRFGKGEVIPPLDLHVPNGSFTVLVGPSGCGKSTLLRMIAGLEDPDCGILELGGRDVTLAEPADRGIAMVFQSYALYPHMTVEKNIEFGLRLARVPASERKEKIAKAAEALQLEALLQRKPAALSGGQRQRVAIGRAIVRDPKLFLFDEPLSNLDAALRAQMRVELAELHKRLGTTMIYVTHDQVEAMTLADRIVVMNQGRIEQIGSPLELYEAPASLFVAEFIGAPKMNILGGKFAEELGAAKVGLRPEHLFVNGQSSEKWTAKVRLVERLGPETIVYARVEDVGDLIIRAESSLEIPGDSELSVSPDLSNVHCFDGHGSRIEKELS